MLFARLLRRSLRIFVVLVVLGVVAMNALLFMQAHTMTTFAAIGERPPQLEKMSPLEKVTTVLGGVKMGRPVNSDNPQDVGLDYQTLSISSVGGATLEAWWVPVAAPKGLIALFHGYGSSKESLLSLARAFNGMGYDTLLTDFQGSGGSTGDDTTLGVREGADVAAVVSYAANLRPGAQVILYGVSMGAASVLRAVAHEGVKPVAIVLDSPFDTMLHAVEHRLERTGVGTFPFAQALVFYGSLQHGYNGFENNPTDYARAVNCPALVLHGEFDPNVAAADANAVLQNLNGPKRLVEFAGDGHSNFVDDSPALWKSSLEQFLAQLPATP